MKFEQVYQLVVMSCGLILSIAGVGCIVVGTLLDNDSRIQSINEARSRTYNTQYWLGLPLIIYGIKSMVLAISQKVKMNIFSLLVSIPLIGLTLVGAILHGTSYAHFLSIERKQNYLEDLDYTCVTNKVNQCKCTINQQTFLQSDTDRSIELPVQCGEQGTLVAFHGAIFALGITCFALVFGILIINIISLFNEFTAHFQPANTDPVENRGFSQEEEEGNGHAIPHEVDQSQNGLHLSQQQLNTSHNDLTPSSPSDELPPSYESLLTTFHVTNGVMNIGTSPFFHRSLPEVNRHARVEYRGETSSDTDDFHLGGSGGGANRGGASGGSGGGLSGGGANRGGASGGGGIGGGLSGGGDSGGGDSGGGGSGGGGSGGGGSGGGGSGGGGSGGGGSGGGGSGGGGSGGGGSGGGGSGGGGSGGGANGGGHGSEGGTSGGDGSGANGGSGGGGSEGGTSGGGDSGRGGGGGESGGGGSEGGTSGGGGGGDSGRGGGGRGGGRSRSGASGGSGTSAVGISGSDGSGGGGRSRGIPQREYSLININEAVTDDGENNAEPGTHGFSEHNSPPNSEMQVIIDIPQTSRNNTSNHSAAVRYRGQLDSSSRNVWPEQQSSQGTTAQNSTNLTTNGNRENDVDHQIHSAEISPEDSSDSAVINPGSVVTEQLLALERTPQDINTDLVTISERDIEHQLASQEPWPQDSTALVTVRELQNINNGQEMSQDRSDLERTAENYVEQIDFETERTKYGGAGMLQEENSVTSDVVVRELNSENSGVLLPVDGQERPMGIQEINDVNSPDLSCEPTENSHVNVLRQEGVFSQHQPSASSSSLPSVTNMGEPSSSGSLFPASHTREMARKSTTRKILLDIIHI